MNQKQKKIVLALCGIALLSLIAVGLYLACGRKSLQKNNPQTDKQVQTKQQENEPQATKNPYEGMVKSELTGKYIKPSVAKKRPYAIMINNIEYAFRNQKGTSKADIIYEALAEGGITRMMAVYEDVSKVKKVGSVRSARHYYVQFAKEWDAIFCHFGHTKYAVSKIKKLGTNNLSGLSAIGGVVYARDLSIRAPHNVFTNGKKMKKGAKKLGYSLTRNSDAMAKHFNFANEDTEPANGKTAKSVTIPFSNYSTCKMKYSAKSKTYKKYEYGQKHMDTYYKKQLAFKNVIIQLVSESNIDHNGYQTMKLGNTSGKGYYYSDGKQISITWKRVETTNEMAYYDESGNVLTINPGKTYIAVYPKNRQNLIK